MAQLWVAVELATKLAVYEVREDGDGVAYASDMVLLAVMKLGLALAIPLDGLIDRGLASG